MRYLVVASLILLPLSVRAGMYQKTESIPFHISSIGTPFAMQTDVEGEFKVNADSVEVTITKSLVRISDHCPYKGERRLGFIRAGLARLINGEQWNIITRSKEFAIEKVMLPNDEFAPGPIELTIPVEEGMDLSQYWIVVELDDNIWDVAKQKWKNGRAYAHSRRDIFRKL